MKIILNTNQIQKNNSFSARNMHFKNIEQKAEYSAELRKIDEEYDSFVSSLNHKKYAQLDQIQNSQYDYAKRLREYKLNKLNEKFFPKKNKLFSLKKLFKIKK